MKNIIRLGLILLSIIFITGCSIFSPVPNVDEKAYVINTPVQPLTKHSRRSLKLFVTPMTAEPLYNSTAMAYSKEAYRISYFVKNKWAEPPAQMLQNMMVQTLQKTHYFTWVDSTTLLPNYNYLLSTDLIELQQVFFPQCSEVRLIVRAKLIDAKTNQLIASKQFTIVQGAPARTPFGGVIAANEAAARLMHQLARFCLQHLR